MDALPNLKAADISPYVVVLEQIRESGLLERTDIDISARIGDIQEKIRQVSAQWYETKLAELQAAPGVNRALPLLLMTDEIEKSAKLLDKRFSEPLLGYVPSSLRVVSADSMDGKKASRYRITVC
jgi:hypothetical protein